jgi:hypothetical protein
MNPPRRIPMELTLRQPALQGILLYQSRHRRRSGQSKTEVKTLLLVFSYRSPVGLRDRKASEWKLCKQSTRPDAPEFVPERNECLLETPTSQKMTDKSVARLISQIEQIRLCQRGILKSGKPWTAFDASVPMVSETICPGDDGVRRSVNAAALPLNAGFPLDPA